MKKSNPIAAVIYCCCLCGIQAASAQVTPDTITPGNVLDYSLKVIEEAEKDLPLTYHAHNAKGYAYYKATQYEAAIESFLKGLEVKPNDPVIAQMIAFLYARLNQHEKSVEWYRKTLKLNPRAERANERLGISLQQLNRMEEATQAFENEVKNYPKDSSPRIYLGERYLAAGRLDDAIKQAEQAAIDEPLLPEPHYLSAKILRKQGKQEEAKEQLKIFRKKKAEETDLIDSLPITRDREKAVQSTAAVHIDMGLIYYQFRRQKDAESHFMTAIRIDPKNETARQQLTLLYQNTRQVEKSLSLYRELVSLNGEKLEYRLKLGLLLGGFKQWDEALEHLRKAQSLVPGNIEIMKSIAKVHLSSGRDPARACQILEYVIVEKSSAENYDLLAWAYLANKQIERSKEALRTAISLEPNNPKYQQRYQKLIQRYGQ